MENSEYETRNPDEPLSSWPCRNGNCRGIVEHWYAGDDEECPVCHTEYNAFGQMLRSDWRGNPSNYNDDISDLDGFEMQYAGDE